MIPRLPDFATRHYDQRYMTNKRITLSNEAAELAEIVEREAPRYTAFLFDIKGMPAQDAQPLLATEVLDIIVDNVGASEWDLGI